MSRVASYATTGFAVVTLACLAACESDSAGLALGEHPRVLFVGNSLTYTNNLPRTFAEVATEGGVSYTTQSVALPNVALIDYVNGTVEGADAVDRGGWAYVVLQQGPTWPGLCGDTLTLAAQAFGDRIRAHGGIPALLMTWPKSGDLAYIDGVFAAYRAAADASQALLIPAGDAWRIAWRDDPSLGLYSSDGYHPSPLGTYLTALVVYERLTGNSALGLRGEARANGAVLDVPEATVRLLQRAAHEAITSLPANITSRAALRRLVSITC